MPQSITEALDQMAGPEGVDLRDTVATMPQALELPDQTQARISQAGTQKRRVALIAASDLKKRGIPFTNTPSGPSPITDETGASLSGLDSRHNIAYDSSGNPRSIHDDATLGDPYAEAPDWTEPKTGNIYKRPKGLPWQQVGTDTGITQAIQDKKVAQVNDRTAAALGGPISDLSTQYRQAQGAAKQSAVATAAQFTQLGVPMQDPQGNSFDMLNTDPATFKSHIESSFNTELSGPKANESPWFGGGKYSSAAEALRQDIATRKAAALAAADQHLATLQPVSELHGQIAQLEQQRQQLHVDRLERINAERQGLGLEPVPPIPGMDTTSEVLPTRQPQIPSEAQSEESQPDTAAAPPEGIVGTPDQTADGSIPVSSSPDAIPPVQEAQEPKQTSLYERVKNFLGSTVGAAADATGEIMRSPVGKIAGAGASLGIQPLLDLLTGQKLGSTAQQEGETLSKIPGLITDPAFHDNGEAKAGRFIGGVIPYIAEGAVAPEAVIPTLFGSGYQGQYESAKAHGADDGTAEKSGLLGGAINAVLGIPLGGAGKIAASLFGKASPSAVEAAFNSAYQREGSLGVANLLGAWKAAVGNLETEGAQTGFKEAALKGLDGVIKEITTTTAGRVAQAAGHAARDAALFGGAQAAQNIVTQGYAPETPTGEGVGEAALGGLVLGGLFGGIDQTGKAKKAARAREDIGNAMGGEPPEPTGQTSEVPPIPQLPAPAESSVQNALQGTNEAPETQAPAQPSPQAEPQGEAPAAHEAAGTPDEGSVQRIEPSVSEIPSEALEQHRAEMEGAKVSDAREATAERQRTEDAAPQTESDGIHKASVQALTEKIADTQALLDISSREGDAVGSAFRKAELRKLNEQLGALTAKTPAATSAASEGSSEIPSIPGSEATQGGGVSSPTSSEESSAPHSPRSEPVPSKVQPSLSEAPKEESRVEPKTAAIVKEVPFPEDAQIAPIPQPESDVSENRTEPRAQQLQPPEIPTSSELHPSETRSEPERRVPSSEPSKEQELASELQQKPIAQKEPAEQSRIQQPPSLESAKGQAGTSSSPQPAIAKPQGKPQKPGDLLHTAVKLKVIQEGSKQQPDATVPTLVVPKGANAIRAVDGRGKVSEVTLDDLDTLKGAGPYKEVTAGKMDRRKVFEPVKGKVTVHQAEAPQPTTENATPEGKQPENRQSKHQGISQGSDLRGNEPQVREEGRRQAGSSGGDEPSKEAAKVPVLTPQAQHIAKLARGAMAGYKAELTALGHPLEIEHSTAQPGSSGIWTDTTRSRIMLDPEQFAKDTAKLDSKQLSELVRRRVHEEVIHVGTIEYAKASSENRAKLMALLKDSELMQRAKEAYGDTWDQQNDFAKAAEAARILIQGPGEVTEEVHRKFLESFLAWLKEKLKHLSAETKELIAGIEAKLGRGRDNETRGPPEHSDAADIQRKIDDLAGELHVAKDILADDPSDEYAKNEAAELTGKLKVQRDKLAKLQSGKIEASPSEPYHSQTQPREDDGTFTEPERLEAAPLQKKLKELREKMTPGLDLVGGIKGGIQSLLLPSAKSPEHLRAAETLGSKLGPMNQRQESARAQFAKDWLTFEKLGVHREGLPVEKNEGIKFMSDVSTGREMSPDMQKIADRMAAQDTQRLNLLEKAGVPLQSIRENYFPGLWTNESRKAFNLAMQEAGEQGIIPEGTGINQATDTQKAWVKARVDKLLESGQGSDKDALSYLTKTALKGKESFRKQKVFDQDIKTAFDFGLRAVSNNPVDTRMLKWAEMDRNIMANQALQEWAQKGQMKISKLGDKIPDGWQKVNDKYGTVYGPREIEVRESNSRLVDEEGNPVSLEDAGLDKLPPEGTKLKVRVPGLMFMGHRIVPDSVGDILNNYLSSSLYNNRYFGKLYTGWMGFANALNQTQLGVGSAFHVGFTTAEAQISSGANLLKDVFGFARGNRSAGQVLKSAKNLTTATVETAMTGDKVLNAWRNPEGTIDPKIAQVVRAVELAGGGFTMERGLQTDQLHRTVSDWFNGHKVRAAMRSPVAGIELMAHPIMSYLVPRQKAGVFAHLAWRIIEQNPDKPLEELTPQFRQAWNRIDARLGQVRYDRLFINNTAKNVVQGTVRAPGWSGGTIAELGGAFKDTYKFFDQWAKEGKLPSDIPDRVAYTASLLLTVGLANALATYLFTGDKPHGLDYLAFRSGGRDEHGNDERFILPTYMKDLLAYTKEPLTTLANKAHPLLSVFGDLIRNKDYYGVKIRNEDDNALKQALDSGGYVAKAFEPFWVRGAKREQEREAGPLRTALPLIGIMPAPKKMVQTPAQRLADEYAKESIPIGGRTQAQADASMAKYRLVEQLRKKEYPDFQTAISKGYITAKDIPALQTRASQTPLQYTVKKLSLDKAEAVYAKASPEEKKSLTPILITKRGNSQIRSNRSLASSRPKFTFAQ